MWNHWGKSPANSRWWSEACAPLRAEEELVSCWWSRGDQLPQKPLKDESWMKDSLRVLKDVIYSDGWMLYFWSFLIGASLNPISLHYPVLQCLGRTRIFDIFDIALSFLVKRWGLSWVAPQAVGIRTKREYACAIAGAALDGCQYSNAGCRCWDLLMGPFVAWIGGENSDITSDLSRNCMTHLSSYVWDGVKWAIKTLAI